MKSEERMNGKAPLKLALACMTIGWLCWSVGNTCRAQTAPANLSPDLQEVVKLSQAHMGDDVILNYVRNSGKSYKLSADDLIYLNSQGVSQGVISALQTATPAGPNPPPVTPPPATPASYAPTPAVPAPVPPVAAPGLAMIAPAPAAPPVGGPPVSLDYFHAQLAPFGTWVQVGGIMYWRPRSEERRVGK